MGVMKNYSSARLLETDVKAITLNYLIEKGLLVPGQAIINEFTLKGYTRRIDLLLPTSKHLIAIEIKSEADSLNRLDGQVSKYLEYVDKVIVVATSKHIKNIMRSVPDQVAVWEVCNGRIKVIQPGRIVPINDTSKLLHLMKANELVKLSNRLGSSMVSKKRHSTENALENVPTSALKKAVIENITKRFFLAYSSFWKTLGGQSVLPEYVQLLSPYREERLFRETAQRAKDLFLKNIAPSNGEDLYLSGLAKMDDTLLFGEPPEHIQHLTAA